MYKIYTRKRGVGMPCFRKILLIMRLTTVILIITLMQVSAAGLAQRVTMTEQNASLEKVFKEMRRQTGYDFLFNVDAIRQLKKVNIEFKNLPLEDALRNCLEGSPLTYSIEEKTVIIKKKTPSFLERMVDRLAAIDVRGRVVDENGKPIEGVLVRVKGTNQATATGANGEFSLRRVAQDAVLVFSGVNVESYEIGVNGKTDLANISLRTKTNQLTEVNVSVNTGYQTISKERSAGSFSKPDMKIVADRSSSMNVLQRLDGLIPGLSINNSPLSQNPFLIRGLSTIGISQVGPVTTYTGSDRSPLFVVDGIQMADVSSINPQDVEDITVLKDATAASIWGASASNGVIIIATKKGKPDSKINIQFDGFINFQGKPDLNYVPVLSSSQFIQTAKELFDPVTYPWATISAYQSGGTGVAPHNVILYNQYRGLITQAQANKSLDSLASINNVQQISDLWYRNASLMNQTLSLSGGGKMHSFYGSLAYTNTNSPRPGDKNNGYKANLRQDFNFNKWLQAYLITDLTNTIASSQFRPPVDNRFYPYQLFQDANGSNLSIPYMAYLSDADRIDYQTRSRVNLDYNPLNEVNNGSTKNDAFLNRITAGVKANLFKGLRFEGLYGYLKGSNNTNVYNAQNSYQVRSELAAFTVAPTAASTPIYYLPSKGGKYASTNAIQKNWTIRNQLVYDNAWNNKQHQLTLLLGQEAQDRLYNVKKTTVRGYDPDLLTSTAVDYATLSTTGVSNPVMINGFLTSTLRNDVYNETEVETRLTSYYANAAYTYQQKYTVNGSWRIDRSNLFGLDKSAQNRPVWSAGVKWILSNEDFMHNVKVVDRMALRATYGVSGNPPAAGSASSYDVLSVSSSSFFPNNRGASLSSIANRKLTWESTKTINLGIDFGILNDRLSGSIDLYQKKTKDLLGYMPVNGFTGNASIIGNYGNMQNKGIEFSINSVNVNHKDFSWSTMFNMAYNKNMITQLNDPTALSTGTQKVFAQYATGFPAFAVFAYKYAGLDNLGDPQIQLANGTITKQRNIAKPEDIVYEGTYQPVWTGGLGNTFRYKNFSLTANAVFNLGHVMRRDVQPFYANSLTGGPFTGMISHYNVFNSNDYSGFTGGQMNPIFLERWKQPGDELITDVPSYVSNTSTSSTRRDVNYYLYSDQNVVSASFVKLRDITLSYNLPESLVKRLKTGSIAVRMQVSNIMLWKANKYDIDPEFHDAASGRRAPSVPFVTDPSINTQSYRFGQGTITLGLHVNF